MSTLHRLIAEKYGFNVDDILEVRERDHVLLAIIRGKGGRFVSKKLRALAAIEDAIKPVAPPSLESILDAWGVTAEYDDEALWVDCPSQLVLSIVLGKRVEIGLVDEALSLNCGVIRFSVGGEYVLSVRPRISLFSEVTDCSHLINF